MDPKAKWNTVWDDVKEIGSNASKVLGNVMKLMDDQTDAKEWVAVVQNSVNLVAGFGKTTTDIISVYKITHVQKAQAIEDETGNANDEVDNEADKDSGKSVAALANTTLDISTINWAQQALAIEDDTDKVLRNLREEEAALNDLTTTVKCIHEPMSEFFQRYSDADVRDMFKKAVFARMADLIKKALTVIAESANLRQDSCGKMLTPDGLDKANLSEKAFCSRDMIDVIKTTNQELLSVVPLLILELQAQVPIIASKPKTPPSAIDPAPIEVKYAVDNSALRSKNFGVAYRRSPNLDDKATGLQPWGSFVFGVECKDKGWIEVRKNGARMYLPKQIGGKVVLIGGGNKVKDMEKDRKMSHRVQVSVKSAVGMSKQKMGCVAMRSVSSYCSCQVTSNGRAVRNETFRTVEMPGTNPTWNHEQELHWELGQCLEFKVYDQGAHWKYKQGQFTLLENQIYPDGYDGELAISDTATVSVRVKLVSAD